MTNKTLDETTIVNELKGSSLFFVSQPHAAGGPTSSQDPVSAREKGLEPVEQPALAQETPDPTIASPGPLRGDEKRSSPPSAEVQPTLPADSMPRTNISSRIDGTIKRSNVPTNEPTNVRTNGSKKIRHTFDIRAEQLLSLKELAVQREVATGERTLLGHLVQEALDLLIERETKTSEIPSSEPSNEQPFVRTFERTVPRT